MEVLVGKRNKDEVKIAPGQRKSVWSQAKASESVRIIPVPGREVGEMVEFGGLLGSAPIMAVNRFSSEQFIRRGGRIPAPVHSLRN